MKRVSRNLLSLALCLFLLAGALPLCAAAKSVGAPFARRTRLVLSGNVTYFTADGTQKTANASSNITDSAEGWSWDAGTKTLTLSGAIIRGDDMQGDWAQSYGIYLPGGCTLVLAEGTHSVVTGGNTDGEMAESYGIYTYGDLTIQGSGSLSAIGGVSPHGQSFGIYHMGYTFDYTTPLNSTLTVEGGNITAIGGTADGSIGIYHYGGGFTISGGTVTATGGNTSSNSCGVEMIYYGNFTVTGGTAFFMGGSAGTTSNGLMLPSDTGYTHRISGGVVTAVGGTSSAGSSERYIAGVVFDSLPLEVSGGLLISSAGVASDPSVSRKALNRALNLAGETIDLLNPDNNESWKTAFAVYGDADTYKVKQDALLDFTAQGAQGNLGTDGYAWDGETLTLKNLILAPTTGTALTLPEGASLELEGVNVVRGGDTTAGNTDSEAVSCRKLNVRENAAGGAFFALGGKADGAGSASYGLRSTDTVTLENGTVWAVGGMAEDSTGLNGSLALKDGAVTALGGVAGNASTGITSLESVTVEGGALTAVGGIAGAESSGASLSGIGENSVMVTGGLLRAIGGTAASSFGIESSATLQISVREGSLAAVGGTADDSIGISGSGTALAVGGNLTAQGGTAGNSFGILMSAQVQGGALTALAGPGSLDSCGMLGDLTVESGTATVADGKQAVSGSLDVTGEDLDVLAGTEADGSGLGAFAPEEIERYKYLRVQPKPSAPPPSPATRYTLTASAGEGGTIEPEGEVRVRPGDSQSFLFTPQENWWLAGLEVDGTVQKAAGNSYAFAGVTEDHTLRALFLPFADMNAGSWYAPDAAALYDRSVMLGVSKTEFGPGQTTSRGMVAAMLWRMEGSPEPKQSAGFTDVKPGAYYEKAIDWAAETGIASGYGNQTFGPDDAMTREQLAAVLYRYAQYKGVDVSAGNDLSKFADAEEVSAYAEEPMEWANAVKLIVGRTETELAPKGMATRAETAAVFRRFLDVTRTA